MSINIEEMVSSFIFSIIASIIATFIYDNVIRNRSIEPAYIFSNEDDEINSIYHLSNREMNRRRVYKIFSIIISLYLIWASLYIPLIVKSGFLSKDLVDLTNSNLSFYLQYLGIHDISFLIIDLEKLKWLCATVGIILLIPCIYFQGKVASFFIKIKNKFYNIDIKDWDVFRAYSPKFKSEVQLLS